MTIPWKSRILCAWHVLRGRPLVFNVSIHGYGDVIEATDNTWVFYSKFHGSECHHVTNLSRSREMIARIDEITEEVRPS